MLQTALYDVGRLGDIASVIARHGFDQIAEAIRTGGGAARIPAHALESAPQRLRLVLQDLGPTFTKLGQVLSTRPDLLPSAWIAEFQKLQDQTAPVDFDTIKKTVEQELGKPLTELFASFDPAPLASASIAQVHRATLPDGRAVVVKVQRPGIQLTLRGDLDLLHVVARILDATIQESGIYRPVDIVKEFERSLFEEVDFLREARNVREFRRHFADRDDLRFPEPIDELTTRAVLTMERLDGTKVTELDRARHDVKRTVQSLLDAMFRMVYVDGYFHADPHPGNILVLPDGRVGFLDFGLVGRLSRGVQEHLIQLSLAIGMKDAESVARLITRLGTPAERVDLVEFRDQIESLMTRHMSGRLEDVDTGSLLTELFDLAMRHKIRVQTDCALLVKATVTFEGVIRMIAPETEISSTLAPYTRQLLLSRYGITALGSTAAKGLLGLVASLREFPLQMDQILGDLQSGRLVVRFKNDELDRLSRSLNDLGSKVFLGLLACGLMVGTCLLVARYTWEIKGVPVWPILSLLGVAALITIVFWWHVLYGRIRKVRLSFWLSLFRKRKGE